MNFPPPGVLPRNFTTIENDERDIGFANLPDLDGLGNELVLSCGNR